MRGETLLELWEVRQGLEEQIAPLAAGRRSGADVEKLRGLAGEMCSRKTSSERFIRSGIAFHRTLAEAAGNIVLLTLWDAIAGLIEKSQRRIIGIPGQPDEALAKHEALLAAVEAGDAKGARRAMREHMEAEGENLRKALLISGGPESASAEAGRKMETGERKAKKSA